MVGITFIPYLIINNKINREPEIKIKVLKTYDYIKLKSIPNDTLYGEIENKIRESNINNFSVRETYINMLLKDNDTDPKIKEELKTLKTIENENNTEAFNFIKKTNTISKILLNRSDLHEFIIMNLNNNLYLLQTNIYNIESWAIKKIDLTIKDVENIFNNNIDDELFKKINLKINDINGFFIYAFYGYNLNIM